MTISKEEKDENCMILKRLKRERTNLGVEMLIKRSISNERFTRKKSDNNMKTFLSVRCFVLTF